MFEFNLKFIIKNDTNIHPATKPSEPHNSIRIVPNTMANNARDTTN